MSGCSTPTKTLIAEEADIITTEPPVSSLRLLVNIEGEGLFACNGVMYTEYKHVGDGVQL